MPEERFVTGLRERADKSAEELMEGLEAYCLREDSHFYDYEVSHLLQEQVSKRPTVYLELVDRINALGRGEVVSGFGHGLRKAIEAKADLDAGQVANMLLRVGQLLREQLLEFTKPEPHWAVRSYIDLVRECSRQEGPWREVSVQSTLLDAARVFMDFAESNSGVLLANQKEGGSDWIMHSLNSDQGLLGWAVCYIASIAVEENDKAERGDRAWDALEGQALANLEAILARREPNFYRVPFGSLIPFMLMRRGPWFDAHRSTIFPEDDVLWEASWSTYVMPRNRYDKVFLALEDQYLRSIARTEALLRDGVDIRDGEWHKIPGEDAALFWLINVIDEDHPVLRRLIDSAPGVLLQDMVEIVANSLERDKASPDRAADLVFLIQSHRKSVAESDKPYWSRLQLLLDALPVSEWFGRLGPSLENCTQAADQIYVELDKFLDNGLREYPQETIERLFTFVIREKTTPWYFLWSRVQPVLQKWQDQYRDTEYGRSLAKLLSREHRYV